MKLPFASVGTRLPVEVVRGDEVGAGVESAADVAAEIFHTVGEARNFNAAPVTPTPANASFQNLTRQKTQKYPNKFRSFRFVV